MNVKVDELLPSALDCNKKMAEAEAAKASDYMRKQAAVEAEKKALLDKLKGPSGVSDEERLKRAAAIINRAVSNGLTEIEVGVFRTAFSRIEAAPSISRSPAGRIPSPGCPRSCLNSGSSICGRRDTK